MELYVLKKMILMIDENRYIREDFENGLITWTLYDEKGRMLHNIISDGRETIQKYDDNGNIIYAMDMYENGKIFEQFWIYGESGKMIMFKNSNGYEYCADTYQSKCIGNECEYFQNNQCVFMNETYEILNNECHLNSHIKNEEYKLSKGKMQLENIKEKQWNYIYDKNFKNNDENKEKSVFMLRS